MIEIVRLKRALSFWRRLPNDPTAIDRVIKEYFRLGYIVRPKFDPEIDVIIESVVNVNEKDVDFRDRTEAIELLRTVADQFSEELLHYVIVNMLTNNIGRDVLLNSKSNMFEFAWRVATFDYSFSLKRIKYSEDAKIGEYVMGLNNDKAMCILSDDDTYYLVMHSKNKLNIRKVSPDNVDSTIRKLNITEKVYLE